MDAYKTRAEWVDDIEAKAAAEYTTGSTDVDEAKRQLIIENLGFVKAVAARFMGRGAEFDELCQAGALGLIRAAGSFDASKKVPLPAYAFSFIEGEIRAFLRKNGSIRLSRAAYETAVRARNASEALTQELGSEYGTAGLADHLQIKPSELCMVLNAVRGCVSLDEAWQETGFTEKNAICDESAELEYDRTLDKVVLNFLMNCLNDREREVVNLRYHRDLTQAQAAKLLGMSQAQVSRYEKNALIKMKKLAKTIK